MSNYRPISLLSNLDKIVEKLIYKRIIQFLEGKKIIYYKQCGFCKNFSSAHDVQFAFANNKFSCGIFIDLAKAFDTVDQNILLSKLNYCEIRGIANDWFKPYLSSRSQIVSINGFSSDHRPIECGIP